MSDTIQIINCPACNSEMEKVYLPDLDINIDVCSNGCGGMFFNNQELQMINASENDIAEVKKAFLGKEFKTVDSSLTRVCPVCGTKMVKTKAFGTEIDTCYNCGAIFLDYNEINTVKLRSHQSAPEPQNQNNEKIGDINLQEFYQDAQSEELVDNWHDEEIDSHGLFGFLRRLFD